MQRTLPSARRTWALLLSVACGLLLFLTLLDASKASFVRQTNEHDGYREPEYGLFGVTLYQPQSADPNLKVSEDFRAALSKAGLKSPSVVEAQFTKAVRTIRPEGTQYWLRAFVRADPKALERGYLSQLTRVYRGATGSSVVFEGICPDGKTHIRFMIDPRAGDRTDFLLTFGPGS